ncbi:MAG: hypothetical protein IJC52_01865 [Clostridia bacterium]|nr:hypothetical protein [Clostridia bacterium]
MRVAIIGSRHAPADAVERIRRHLPPSTSEIVSGGADGIDTAAKEIAHELGIPLKEFLPDYALFGKRAPLVRNDQIVDYADMVLAFWDGESRGTQYVIGECLKRQKRVVYISLD